MSLSVGIVGLPNTGKSTLFNALLAKRLAKVADFPFTTIDPHEGVVDVEDKKLNKLSSIVKPVKTTPATITFVDIAGLVKGANKGEGLGNEFLSHIREVDVIMHLVRDFESESVVHTLSTVDPRRDIEIIQTELILKDLDSINKRLEQEKDQANKNLLFKIKKQLDKSNNFSLKELGDEEIEYIKELQLFSEKPYFYVFNISESKLNEKTINEYLKKGYLTICAKLEEDLIDLEKNEQQEYLNSFGLQKSGLEKVIKKAYQLLDLITFYTIKGGNEVKAWSLKKGFNAFKAAEKVHTDIAKGFIKAEVINVDNLISIGNWNKAKEEGKVRLEGKDYIVQDQDVIEFKFKV